MLRARIDLLRDYELWVECFVCLNMAGLAGDIFLAHSQNRFRSPWEYLPFLFSIAAAAILVLLVGVRRSWPRTWRYVGHAIGWGAVIVGVTGLVLHLDSRFFEERTIRSLTYAAPFAAPLAYAGLGLLLLANRFVPWQTPEWPRWILLLALGGFVGNFVFSLTDHAQNGFFNAIEWVPVVSSAFTIGFLVVPLVMTVDEGYLRLCAAVLGLQAVVGIVGFTYHGLSIVHQPAATWFERTLSGAPPMAPLLLPNLAVLAAMALWPLWLERLAKRENA
jgi:hypothetical protein